MRSMCNAVMMCQRADVEVAVVVEMTQAYRNWQQCQKARRVDIADVVPVHDCGHCNTELYNLDTANFFLPASILEVAGKGID